MAIAADAAPDRRVELSPEPAPEPLKKLAAVVVPPSAAAAVKPVVTEDSTVVALKVLSCILRAKEQLGRGKVAKILAGSEDVSIQDFRSLTTYGILSSYPIRTITEIIDRMIEEGLHRRGRGPAPGDCGHAAERPSVPEGSPPIVQDDGFDVAESSR